MQCRHAGRHSDSQLDLSKRWQFKAMGIDNPNQDPATLLPQMIARDIFVRNGSTSKARKPTADQLLHLDDLNRFKNERRWIDAMTKQAQKDTQRLQLRPAVEAVAGFQHSAGSKPKSVSKTPLFADWHHGA